MREPNPGPHRTGVHHSLKVLRTLGEARAIAFGSPRAGRALGELDWQPAQAAAIQRDDFRTAWHAGHVSALLSNGVDVIAATQTGGVWLLASTVAPSPLAGYTSKPLSDGWEVPDVVCLAWGTGPWQVFAGCRGGGALVLLEFDGSFGSLEHQGSTFLPLPFSRVIAMAVLRDLNRMVVATGELGGVWWSPIPQPATNKAGWDWRQAQGLAGLSTFQSLAEGPGGSVVVAQEQAAALGEGLPARGTTLHRGTFEGGELVFRQARIEGVDIKSLRRTSIASCADQPARMVAVAAAPDNTLFAVLASQDGGESWQAKPTPDKAVAGNQGSYNNCIAVSPQNPDRVVIGWRSQAPFWSHDGGNSWHQPPTPAAPPHLHSDLHALHFVRNPHGDEPLFVGGDGGVVVTRDLGHTYHSQFNRPLNNLQFYGGNKPSVLGTLGGSLTASSRYPGLLAGGTQDNGNVYRQPDVLRRGVPRQAGSQWLLLVGGDGDLNRFVDSLGILLSFNNGNVKLGLSIWDEATRRFMDGPVETIPAADDAGGVAPTAVELVQSPEFRRSGKLMVAVVGTAEGAVYGLFAGSAVGRDPGNRGLELVRLGAVNGLVSALAASDGANVLVGTSEGEVFSLGSATGGVSKHSLPADADGEVTRLELFPPPFAVWSNKHNALALAGGRILRFDGVTWSTTTGTDWATFAVDVLSERIFAATDADVFVSEDWGKTWLDASQGLPARPHCSDLRIASDGQGGRDLYLATYGRSVWRTTIARKLDEGIVELPPKALEILVGVIQDGGGLVRLGKRFVKLPPRPLVRDILAALVAEDVASSMSEDSAQSSREIRRTALREIAAIALREAEQLG